MLTVIEVIILRRSLCFSAVSLFCTKVFVPFFWSINLETFPPPPHALSFLQQSLYHRNISSLKTIYALQRNFELCIPRKGIARPESQFPHSCVCERSIYFPRLVHLFSCCRIGRPIMGIHKSLTET